MLKSRGWRFSSQESINEEKQVAKTMRIGGTIGEYASSVLSFASLVMARKTGSKAWMNVLAASTVTGVISVGVASFGHGMEDVLDNLYVVDDYDID